MTRVKILLSYDHELGLGGAKSYSGNMFEPTDRLLDTADELGVPITLFTDVCCAEQFRSWDRERFFDPYRAQIADTVRRGHDVQLHLHPHWLDSEYRDRKFIPASTYSLGTFRDREAPKNIPGIVAGGIALLNELCLEQDPGYQCIAYRAGGFSLTPNTGDILTALHDAGIRIESTIAPDYRFACDLWSVDFRGMPQQANWFIDSNGPLNQPAESGLYEIPIATRPRTPLNNIPFLIRRVTNAKNRHDSQGWAIDVGNTPLLQKLGRLVPQSAWLLSFDHYAETLGSLMQTLRYHLNRHRSDEMIALSTVSHPKLMGPYARSLMTDFVNRVRADYGDSVEFCTYQQFCASCLAQPEPVTA